MAYDRLLKTLQAIKADRKRFRKVQELVDQQAVDHGLWYEAETASETYLQQELRKLHAAIEGTRLNG